MESLSIDTQRLHLRSLTPDDLGDSFALLANSITRM